MAAHLVRWNKKYRDAGLVILDIDNGDIDSWDALGRHVEDHQLTYPVAWDEGGETNRTFGVRAYPAAYLLDKQGRVIFEGVPIPAAGALEKRIQELLGLDAS